MITATLTSGKLTIRVRFHDDGVYSVRVFREDQPDKNNEFCTFTIPSILGLQPGAPAALEHAARMALSTIQDTSLMRLGDLGPEGWRLQRH